MGIPPDPGDFQRHAHASIPVGTHTGVALGIGVLAMELIVPLALGVWMFRRRDW
jgi:hypothetical protein